MTDLAALGTDLAHARCAEIAGVDRHRRRALGTAVAFERTDAEAVFKRRGQAAGKFLGAGHDVLQAAELFRRTAAQVHLEECRGCQQERDRVALDQLADPAPVERVGMIHHADAERCRQAERDGEPERVEERQDAEDLVVMGKRERLAHLLDVGHDVVLGQHHPFRLAGTAAGKDDRCQAVEQRVFSARCSVFRFLCDPAGSNELRRHRLIGGRLFQHAIQHRRRQQPEKQGPHFLEKPRFGGEIFQQQCLAGHGDVHLVEKCPRSDHGLELALVRAGCQHLIVGGVVEVDRDLSEQQRGVVDQRAGHRRR